MLVSTEKTIQRLWSRFSTTGSVSDTPHSGRPRVTTPRETAIFGEPKGKTDSNLQLKRLKLCLTPKTVRNRLRDNGMRERRPTLIPDHRRRRLDWARSHVARGIRWWNRVLFSDEGRFLLRRLDGRRRVYRRRGERYLDECVARQDAFGVVSLMV